MTAIETFRTQISVDVLKDPYNRIWSTASLDRAINIARNKIQADMPNMFTDTDGSTTIAWLASTETYSLPSDFLIAQYVRWNGVKLDRTTKKQIDSIYPAPANSTPTNYYLYWSNIGVYPIPAGPGTLTVAYTKLLPAITESQDSTNPAYLDWAICCLAWSICYAQVYKVELANYRESQYMAETTKYKMFATRDENLTFDLHPRRPQLGSQNNYMQP